MESTIALIKKAHLGDKKAREQVINDNAGLVWCVVKRFIGRGTEAEDLFQIGNIGLLKAVDRFDFSYDVKFSTYAIPLITGEIKRFLRDDGMIKVSRSLKELAMKAYAIRETRLRTRGSEPTLEELATALEVEKEDLVLAFEASVEVESIYKPIYQREGEEVYLVDKIEEKTGGEEEIVNKLLLGQMLGELDEKEKELIYLRYFLSLTQAETGRTLSISQVQVSRLEKKILQSMRSKHNG